MQSVADIEGAWQDCGFSSGLIARCQKYWDVPVTDVPNAALAMFLRQRLALKIVIPEAQKRLEAGVVDESELYEEELANALRETSDA
jgi:hypothetical protein